MKWMLASMAIMLMFGAAPAMSAEFPKTGEAEYDTYYVDHPVAKIDSEAGTGTIVDNTGITRNVKGEVPFHHMSIRCLAHRSLVGETLHRNGSCVENRQRWRQRIHDLRRQKPLPDGRHGEI